MANSARTRPLVVGIILSGWFLGVVLAGAYALASEELAGPQTLFLSGLIALGLLVIALCFVPLQSKAKIYLCVISTLLPLYAYEAYVRTHSQGACIRDCAHAQLPLVELKQGMLVEVEGLAGKDGRFFADDLEIKQGLADPRDRVTAVIESVDPQGANLRALGFSIEFTHSVRFLDPRDRPIDGSALHVGDCWKIYGRAHSATSFEASKLKQCDPSHANKIKLQGPITSEVRVSGGAQLFQLAGRQVRVEGEARVTLRGTDGETVSVRVKGAKKWSKYDVVMEMRGEGAQAYPAVHPLILIHNPLEIEGYELIPLSGIPLAKTVFCNEHGPTLIYDSDEYGFNNPPGIWSRPIEVALVGDSYTQGACVEADAHFATIIRNHIPATVSLGMGGNGPLVELASIREYLSRYKPKQVFWFYFEGNDLIHYWIRDPDDKSDIRRELEQKRMRRYLEPDFTQDLLGKRDLIRKAMIDFVERRLKDKTKSLRRESTQVPAPPSLLETAGEFVTLRRFLATVVDVSTAMALQHRRLSEARKILPLYREILLRARDEIAGWGGHLSMVYLPGGQTISGKQEHPLRKQVLELWAELGIDVIDPTASFLDCDNPKALQPRHYSAKGNAIVAEAVLSRLEH